LVSNSHIVGVSYSFIMMIFQKDRHYRFDFFYLLIFILLVVTAILS